MGNLVTGGGRKVETEIQGKETMEKVDDKIVIVKKDLTEHENVPLVDRVERLTKMTEDEVEHVMDKRTVEKDVEEDIDRKINLEEEESKTNVKFEERKTNC